MEIETLSRINQLWDKVYPYLARTILKDYDERTGKITVLELGPFSGGITREFLKLCQGKLYIGEESKDVLGYLKEFLGREAIEKGVTLVKTRLSELPFPEGLFDLVIMRGAFFFSEELEDILSEIYRVLRIGGVAKVGGGYGKDTPSPIIEEIQEESKRLNYALGRIWMDEKKVAEILLRASFLKNASLEKEGGLWIKIRKG